MLILLSNEKIIWRAIKNLSLRFIDQVEQKIHGKLCEMAMANFVKMTVIGDEIFI